MSTSKSTQPVASSDRREAGNSIHSVRDFVSYRLSVLSRVLDRTTEARMVKLSDLALTENRILGLLYDARPTTVRAVAKEMCLDKAQVSRAMSKLVKHGYASRKIDPVDRRSAVFRISEAGRTYYQRHIAEARTMQLDLLGNLEPDEIAKLDSAIAKLMDFAERRAEANEDTSDADLPRARRGLASPAE